MTMFPQRPSEVPPPCDDWQNAYERKVQDFAEETRKTSILISALKDLGHTPTKHGFKETCPGCRALAEVGAL